MESSHRDCGFDPRHAYSRGFCLMRCIVRGIDFLVGEGILNDIQPTVSRIA